MLAKLVSSGNGARGAVDYVTHDPATPAMSRPTTAERVAWTSTSPALAAVGVDDPEEAPAAMRALIASAPELKRAAGVSARGRRLKKPFTHLVLSLPPGQHLDRAQWMDAAGRRPGTRAGGEHASTSRHCTPTRGTSTCT